MHCLTLKVRSAEYLLFHYLVLRICKSDFHISEINNFHFLEILAASKAQDPIYELQEPNSYQCCGFHQFHILEFPSYAKQGTRTRNYGLECAQKKENSWVSQSLESQVQWVLKAGKNLRKFTDLFTIVVLRSPHFSPITFGQRPEYISFTSSKNVLDWD